MNGLVRNNNCQSVEGEEVVRCTVDDLYVIGEGEMGSLRSLFSLSPPLTCSLRSRSFRFED